MKTDPLISVIIPVKNGEPWLRDLFTALSGQSLADKMEVICLDSGSTDNSTSIIKENNARLVSVMPEEFNHGLTRNRGALLALGRYVVMTVQDARPADNRWLEKLLEGFTDEKVAGVCGQQIVPHDRDKNPVQWFFPQNEPKLEIYGFENPAMFDLLPPVEKKRICGWDDVAACYRKEALLKVPFRKISFAEDAAWAMDALRAGYKIAYNKYARVFHYHHELPEFAVRRRLIVHYYRYHLFGYVDSRPALSFKRKLSMLKTILKAGIPVHEKWYWWKYNMDLYRSNVNAFDIFCKALQQGDDGLELMFNHYCLQVPVASHLPEM